ncbi:MAG TPA: malto-oligosyltrehalose trehalohydrolase [Solirubrobacteraceae bacterium]|nr:malto-oligosyltrehalose trehalohydrolase [Solirubrobacteraceae bacterium]
MTLPWREPLGAHPRADGATLFRAWAPRARSLALASGGDELELEHAGLGVFELVADVGAQADYEFVLTSAASGERLVLPDPCSRHQPLGLRGPSRVLDPAGFEWGDQAFRMPQRSELVLYELHVGTFTPEGSFAAAAAQLPALAALGITAVELMPVADFPGMRGWGYDGVYLSAAHRCYGGPHALAAFVDAAHRAGVAVVLDVVYNHVGASGVAALEAFGPYLTDKYTTFWGKAVNYDDAGCDAVREWVLQSAVGWVRDFHIDGLRLDAIHAIYDASPTHIVAEIAERVHAENPAALVIAESGLNDPRVIRPRGQGGWAADAQWADDFHHALRALLSGERDGYYADFGTVGDLAKAFRRPFVYDGRYSSFRQRCFGAPADDRPAEQFVVFDQNHDQVGNRALGDRLPRRLQPLAALCTLLSPFVPLLFMGEEYGEQAPFQFFADHIDADIAAATREGRRREFATFASFAEEVPDPQDRATFERSRLTRSEDPSLASLYRELLRVRRTLSGEAEVSFDEERRWLRVRRSGGEILCNFSGERLELPVEEGRRILLSTDPENHQRTDAAAVVLEPCSGALVS